MSDKIRLRCGDTNPVIAAVDSSTVIEIGDLLWQDVDDAKPASLFTCPDHDLWECFVNNFLGVAMQRSHSGDTDPIRVATTGVFEFDCPSGTFELGDLVGAYKDSEGGGLLNQQVENVSASRHAVGRVAKRAATAVSSVLVNIRSTVMTGGILRG